MNVYEAIITRRSTRKYTDRQPAKELVEKIVEAGRHAPSGGNNQTTHFFVITDKEVLAELAVKAREAFSKMEVTENTYRSLANSIISSKTTDYNFHRNAPVLIALANDKDYGNNMADVACALENMLILANDMDLGTCYVNQLNWLNEEESLLEVFRRYGMKANERIYAALTLGYADTESGLPERTPLPRKGNEVTWIEG